MAKKKQQKRIYFLPPWANSWSMTSPSKVLGECQPLQVALSQVKHTSVTENHSHREETVKKIASVKQWNAVIRG